MLSEAMHEAKIRPIEKADNEAIAAVIRMVMPEFGACGPGFSIEDREVDFMYEAYQEPRAAYWVIELNGKVVGGAGVAQLEGADKDICELKKMYYLPEARGLGLGRKAMDLCIHKAKEFGFKKMYLETLESMTSAGRLYRSYGFEKLENHLGNTGHTGCDTHYIKEL